MVKKMTEGVGKKIVEALKKQSEIEITAIPSKQETEDIDIFEETTESFDNNFDEEDIAVEDIPENDNNNFFEEPKIQAVSSTTENNYTDLSDIEAPVMQAFNYHQQMRQNKPQDNFINELDTFEIPSNISVLKKLISQLPSGVSKHTGAQIIKQTMEALGISMKGVLQEAQQVQEGLNSSAKECQNNIQEYKKQILILEKQAQNYHRQYSALNELISLFIQTGV